MSMLNSVLFLVASYDVTASRTISKISNYFIEFLVLSISTLVMAILCACFIIVYHRWLETSKNKYAITVGLFGIAGALLFFYYYRTPLFLYCVVFMLYYQLYVKSRKTKARRAPSYTLLWSIAFAFIFSPIMFLLKPDNDYPSYTWWQLLNIVSFISIVSAHLFIKNIYPKWFQKEW